MPQCLLQDPLEKITKVERTIKIVLKEAKDKNSDQKTNIETTFELLV